jgi:hypothetical protein
MRPVVTVLMLAWLWRLWLAFVLCARLARLDLALVPTHPGPVADTIALYESARKMRSVPIGRRSLLAILLPAAIPHVAVLAIEIPVKDLLLGLLKTLA